MYRRSLTLFLPTTCTLFYMTFVMAVASANPPSQKSVQHVYGIYLMHGSEPLDNLEQRVPGAYWIDGYFMQVPADAQVCWHDSSLSFTASLNRLGLPLAETADSKICGTADRSDLYTEAWITYGALLRADGAVVATRIDIWHVDRSVQLSTSKNRSPTSTDTAHCVAGDDPTLEYPHEASIRTICDESVSNYIYRVFENLRWPFSAVRSGENNKDESIRIYIVKPFKILRNDDFETIDGSRNQIDVAGREFYHNPQVGQVSNQMIIAPDGALLIPDTVLAHLHNEAQLASLLSYMLVLRNQYAIDHLRRVQSIRPHAWSFNSSTNGTTNWKYMSLFITNLNEETLRLGINRLWKTGYDIKEAPFAWTVARGKAEPEQTLKPSDAFPWYATYAISYINRYYSDVNYSKLKRGDAEYQQFLDKLRKADPKAFTGESASARR